MLNYQNDQAAGLRRLMGSAKPRVVSIVSASPAQDQPRMLTNLAASLLTQDADVLLVHASEHSSQSRYGVDKLPALLDISCGKLSLQNAVIKANHGHAIAKLMPLVAQNIMMDSDIKQQLNDTFNELASQYEVVLVDASLNADYLLPIAALNEGEILIQLTRHPESIKNAYTLMKKICMRLGRRPFGIIVADANDAQALTTFNNISQVANRFMQIELEFFGAIPPDEHLRRAAKLGRSVIDAFPMATASAAFKQIGQRLGYKNDYSQDYQTNTTHASFN